MIYTSRGEEGESESLKCLLAWKRVCIKMSEGGSMKKKGEGQKLAKIYFRWINFRLDKISRTVTSVDFCVV